MISLCLANRDEKAPTMMGFRAINAAIIAEYKGDAIIPEVNNKFSLITLVLNFAVSPIPMTSD